MQHLNGAGHRKGFVHVATRRLAKLEKQDGPDPLSTRKEAVSHGFQQLFLRHLGLKVPFKCILRPLPAAQIFLSV
jgi:hypothetical protein